MKTDISKKLDLIASIFIFAAILLLFLFMFAGLIRGFINISHLFLVDSRPPTNQVFHAIAITLSVIKAYQILVSYFRDHHIKVKFMVEIAIINSTVEILFNAENIELPILIVLAVFSIANLLIYLLLGNRFDAVDAEAGNPH